MRTGWRLIERASGAVVVSELELADGFWSRLKGLQFRAALPPGRGLLLVPCGSIHTFWMRFSIDVVMIDRQGCVLGVRHGVRPWRMVKAVRGTHAILEVPVDTATVTPGTTLRLVPVLGGQGPLPAFTSRWESERERS